MKSKSIDMCNGPLMGKILVFAAPMILSGVLQLLFNAVDMVVVGQFAGNVALAAVGATSSTINLLVNLFTSLAVGVSVTISQNYGARCYDDVSETVHTAMLVSIISGVAVGVVGFFGARSILSLLDTPKNIIDSAVLYMRIYFIGMPASMVYNFGASILRAVGNTKQPMYYLLFAGVVNALLNLLFVIVFGMDVDGVAVATVVSQVLSAALVLRKLLISEDCLKLDLTKLKICRDKLAMIMKIGIPASISSSIFSLSNMLIQSSLNSFDNENIIAGNTIAGNIEGFIYVSMNTFNHAAITFTGQNLGAGKYDRIKKVLFSSTALVTLIGAALGGLFLLFDTNLLGLYSREPVVIAYGARRMLIICTTYYICGIMEVLVGTLRGMGISALTSFISVLGVVGIRVLWIFTVFARYRTLEALYWSYPVSWTAICLALIVLFILGYKKLKCTHPEQE